MLGLLLKNQFKIFFAHVRGGRLLKKKSTLFSLVAVAVLPLLIINQTTDMFYAWLLMPNLGAAFLVRFVSTSLLGVMVLLILTGLPGVMHHFFLAPDVPLLQTLPIRERDMFAAKLVQSTMNNAGMFFAIGLPLLISMAIAFDVSPLIYVWILLGSILFILIPTALSALLTFSLARLFSIKKMRRASTLILGLFLILAWVGFQFLRLARLDPTMGEFEADTAANVATFMQRLDISIFPSDWLVGSIYSAIQNSWSSFALNVVFLVGSALVMTIIVVLWRIRLQNYDIHLEGTSKPLAGKNANNVRASSVWQAIIIKDHHLMMRDTRFFQSSLLLLAMLLLAPFFTSVESVNSGETLAFLVAYTPVIILSLIVSSTLARQSLPLERLSFSLLRSAPLSIEQIVNAKWLRIFLMVLPVALLSVLTTALKSGTATILMPMLVVHAGLVLCGASLGLVAAAVSTHFDWTDPRYMGNPATVYLFSFIVLLIGAVGIGIWSVGFILGQQIIAFLVFFVYVFLVFWVSLRIAKSRLNKLNWIY